MRGLVVAAIVSVLAAAGCGESDSTDPSASVSVKLKLALPSDPIADEGTSTGITLTDAEGDEVYGEDFWKLPRGRPNDATDTTTYDLDEVDLTPGNHEIDAVIRACNASGCSAEDLGSPVVHCRANPGIDVDMQITVAYRDRKQRAGCGFVVQ